jgi:hypothetical protein
MNCQQYHQTHQEFKELKARFSEKLKELRETGKIDPEIQELKEKLQEKQKEMKPLLEKYFSKFDFKGEIEGFIRGIKAFQFISKNQILIGGGDPFEGSELKILEKKPTGEWEFQEELIEGFNNLINIIQPLSENQILIGGIMVS